MSSMNRALVSALVAFSVLAQNRVWAIVETGVVGDSAIQRLIPKPKYCLPAGGVCRLSGPVAFSLPRDESLSEETVRLTLGASLKLSAKPSDQPPPVGLQLLVGDPDAVGALSAKAGGSGASIKDLAKAKDVTRQVPQGYRLRVERDRIVIVGCTGEGVLNGLRTLAQLSADGPIPQCEIVDWPDMSLRAGHLCYHLIRETLAYNTPDFDALLDQIDRFASVKMNAVLLELESLFPFKRHPAISCKIAFTPEQIARLRDRLETHHMEIIPLVQCLGHAYNVLTHDEYAEYRETPDKIQQYCPTNPKVCDLYMEFVDEYMAMFPGLRQWHLGGDESRQLGECPRCKAKVEQEGYSKLYVDHVGEVARRVAAKGLTPMVWGDMLQHYPEALDLLPRGLKIVYWNYDLPGGGRRYAVNMFRVKGYQVIGATGIRFSQSGTELSVYYPRALRGLESLIPLMHRDGCREIMTTNWMKGSPHESTDYGLVYAAALCWNKAISRGDFQKRYAALTFGSADPRICLLYETLSLWLPYAEPVQMHMPDRLDRFDLSGLRFPEKWRRYSSPTNEPEVLAQLYAGLGAADDALRTLETLRAECTRKPRPFQMLELSAKCIRAKARLGIALHEGRRLEEAPADEADILRWCSEQPAILGAWRAAKEKHCRLLSETGFQPCVDFANELMFEPAESVFLIEMGKRLAGRIQADSSPEDVAVAYLDNPGPPYRRGFVHGETFRAEIAAAIAQYCRKMDTASQWQRALCRRMQTYVTERFPEIMDELRGIADGSGRSFEEIFWLNAFNAISRIEGPQSCSTVINKGAAGAIHLAKTSDIDPPGRRVVLLRRVRHEGYDFYAFGWVGTVWVQVGLNRAGLGVGTNSGPVKPGQTGEGVPQHFGLYPLLYRTSNVDEALAALSQYDFAGKGLVMGLVDARGNAAVVEKSGTDQGVRPLEGARLFGVNDFVTPHMRPFNISRGPDSLGNCDRRRMHLVRWAAQSGTAPARQALLDLLADVKSEGAICQTGQEGLVTRAAALVSPKSGTLLLTGLPPSQRRYAKWTFGD